MEDLINANGKSSMSGAAARTGEFSIKRRSKDNEY